MNIELFGVLIAISGLISTMSFYSISTLVYVDYRNREKAKQRYAKDPNLEVLAENYYVPTITIGALLTWIFFWIIPGINLVTLLVTILIFCYRGLKKIWHIPVIDW